MILALLAVVRADPDVLRLPSARLGVSVGTPGASAALWFGDRGIAVAGSSANVGVFAAMRTPIRSGWRAGCDGGLVSPLASPGLAVEADGWFGVMWRGRWADLGVDLVAPAAISLLDGAARVGARLDPRAGVHIDAWTLSLSSGAGIVQATGAGWALDLRAAISLGWEGPPPPYQPPPGPP